jgi:hypothetical protein
MDSTTLLIIIIIVLLVGGGGWYGRGRWFQDRRWFRAPIRAGQGCRQRCAKANRSATVGAR